MRKFVVITVSKLLGVEKKYFQFLEDAKAYKKMEVSSASLFGTTKVVLKQVKNNK